jgi:RNA polymerase sigma-54 factor
MYQFQYTTLRPVTTAHLAQTMTLLALTSAELHQQIEKELASNPALELDETRRCPTCHRVLPPQGACPVCSRPQTELSEEPVVFISPRDEFYQRGEHTEAEDIEDPYSSTVEELPTYVFRQIATELDQTDRKIAAYLLTHLDEDGLLTIPLIEAAQYLHLPISRIEKVQRLIQRADPIGVGSTSPQGALLVQLEVLSETQRVPELAEKIVRESMDQMTRRQFSELAHKFKTTLRQIQNTVTFISENLNPFPARSHWGDTRQPAPKAGQVYHQPDIIIGHYNDDPKDRLLVEIVSPLYGTLRVNPLFRQAISQAEQETRGALKEDLERASLFVKCLQQRDHTMLRLMQRVVSIQKDFILYGEKYLKPLTRSTLSKELEVHESTISRAVSSKTVQLPNRKIIPLSSFFDRSLNVRTVLCEIIANEAAPLSDAALVDILGEAGFKVARRTVAKYRAMEGILPAHLRRAPVQSL